MYQDAGAKVLSRDAVVETANVLTQIRPPDDDLQPKLSGKTLISTIQPAINAELYETLTKQSTNVFALDCVPRMLSRGQSYDILSSQANIAGYRAVIEAAENFPRFFAGQVCAKLTMQSSPLANALTQSITNNHLYFALFIR